MAISDEAVKAKTGKQWKEWFKILDSAGLKGKTHKEIVTYLEKKYPKITEWYRQMITVTYEQASGIRKKHENPNGFAISVSKVIQSPAKPLFFAVADEEERKSWLNDDILISKATKYKSVRAKWSDGKTKLDIDIYVKGASKCQIVVQHSNLSNYASAEKMKAYWKNKLEKLRDKLSAS